jgi:hypothetical protein
VRTNRLGGLLTRLLPSSPPNGSPSLQNRRTAILVTLLCHGKSVCEDEIAAGRVIGECDVDPDIRLEGDVVGSNATVGQ